jgi:hypothetical protein
MMSLKLGLGLTSVRRPVSSGTPDYDIPGTNLLTQPQAFDHADWTKTGITVTANAAAGPDGATVADKLTKFASGGQGVISQNYTITVADYILTLIAKPDGYTKIGFREGNQTGAYAAFNMSGGGSVLDQGVGVSAASISALAEAGYYKMEIPLTFGAIGNSHGFTIWSLDPTYTTGSVLGSWTGDGTSGILLWKAHLRVA